MDAQELRNLSEAYMEVYQNLDEVIRDEYYLIENVSTGNARRASSRRAPISQRVSDSEIDKIKSNPQLLSKRKEAEDKKKEKELSAKLEPIIKRKEELDNLSKQNPKGGISGEAKKLTRRNKDGRKGKETPRNRAKRTGEGIETIPLHLRKTPEEHESGRRRLNILSALRDPHWGTRAANYDWRQGRRSSRSERLGLNKEEYECLMNYILSERYADSYDEAEYLLENILEEDFNKIVEEFKDLTPEKEKRVKKRMEDLTGKMQHHTDQAKRNTEEFTKRKEGKGLLAKIKQIIVGNEGPRSRVLQHVAKGRKYAKHIENAQDALSRSSAGRSASLINKTNKVRQRLKNLGVNPDAGPDANNIRRFRKEDLDVYNLLLDYLLDEGYAETPEAAESIMVNMGEEWISTILEVSIAYKENDLRRRRITYTQSPYLKAKPKKKSIG